MRRFAVLLTVLSLMALSAAYAAADTELPVFKVGDEVYACNCGKGCDCDTLAFKPGKCVCGKPMVKGTIASIGNGKAVIKTAKWEREFVTVAKYACACGKGCDCGTISQKPGKCVCGKPMKLVTAKK